MASTVSSMWPESVERRRGADRWVCFNKGDWDVGCEKYSRRHESSNEVIERRIAPNELIDR